MAHPFAAPIQDEATRRFNENMAKIEDERRQRGDMPTTTVDYTRGGASPGKDMAGKPLVAPKPAQPEQGAAAGGTGAIGSFKQRQQAQARAGIAKGYTDGAAAARQQSAAAYAEQEQAATALREQHNKLAYNLYDALSKADPNDRATKAYVDSAVNEFGKQWAAQLEAKGARLLRPHYATRTGPDGQKQLVAQFTIVKADGTQKVVNYGAEELMAGLKKHGVPDEAFTKPQQDGAGGKTGASGAAKGGGESSELKFDKDLYNSLSITGKRKYLAARGLDFDEADFAPESQPGASASGSSSGKGGASADPGAEYALWQKYAAEESDVGKGILMRQAQAAGYDTSGWGSGGPQQADVQPPEPRNPARDNAPKPATNYGGNWLGKANDQGYLERDEGSPDGKPVAYDHKQFTTLLGDLENYDNLGTDKTTFIKKEVGEDGKVRFVISDQALKQSVNGKDSGIVKMLEAAGATREDFETKGTPGGGLSEKGSKWTLTEDQLKAAQEYAKEGFAFKEDKEAYDADVNASKERAARGEAERKRSRQAQLAHERETKARLAQEKRDTQAAAEKEAADAAEAERHERATVRPVEGEIRESGNFVVQGRQGRDVSSIKDKRDGKVYDIVKGEDGEWGVREQDDKDGKTFRKWADFQEKSSKDIAAGPARGTKEEQDAALDSEGGMDIVLGVNNDGSPRKANVKRGKDGRIVVRRGPGGEGVSMSEEDFRAALHEDVERRSRSRS